MPAFAPNCRKNLSCHGRQKRFLSWRRRRDSNPRTAFDRYTISNRARSTGLRDFSIAVRTDLPIQFVSLHIIYDTHIKSQAQSFSSRRRRVILGGAGRFRRPRRPVFAYFTTTFCSPSISCSSRSRAGWMTQRAPRRLPLSAKNSTMPSSPGNISSSSSMRRISF